MDQFFVRLVLLLFSAASIQSFPSGVQNRQSSNLDSTSALGALATAQSNANANGPGSTVEISGIVSGDTSSNLQAQSSPEAPSTSGINSQVNCQQGSTSTASGGTNADAGASGDCLMNIDNNGQHQNNAASKEVADKVVIGVEGQVNSQVAQQNGNDVPTGEATINQATIQSDNAAGAYQLIHGPQATTAFTGVVNAQGEAVHGTQESLLTHAAGDTNIQSLITPFGSEPKSRK